MTNINQIFDKLKSYLPFTPNKDQDQALRKIAEFLCPDNNSDFFILTGPAGSGKTSLVKSLVYHFFNNDTSFHAASPTGRSARLLSKHSGCHARTIHSLLFNPEFDDDSMQITLIPKVNKAHEDQRFFIIDEASMISDRANSEGKFIQSNSLLKQLISYVKAGNTKNKIILIGDRYQLPPVNSNHSPALSCKYISEKYGLNGSHFDLQIVERQKADSYILKTANEILESFQKGVNYSLDSFKQGYNFSSAIKYYLNDFNKNDKDHAVMIALSNGQVNALNTWTRKFRYNYKDHHKVMPGELMICNHNCQLGDEILQKGQHFKVNKAWKPEQFADMHFINAEIEFENTGNHLVTTKSKILLESIVSRDGNIPLKDEKNLLHEAYKRNKKFRESKNVCDDAFVNAIRARYGYALTCHKAQGGEWKNVYLHPGYKKENLRWLYTAVTRASQELFSWADK